MSIHEKKVCLISGGTRGIGLAISERLVQKGYNMATFSRHQDQLDEFQKTIESLGAKALTFCGDGTDVSFLKQVVDETLKEFGKIHVLINNAGMYFRAKVEEIKIEDWDHCLNLNLRAPMVLTQLCLPSLKKQEGAAVINIVSMAGKMGFPNGGTYCASKHGLMGLTHSLYEEVREDGIKVSAICPGMVETDMVRGLGMDEKKMIMPEDIAETIEYVLDVSPRSCPVEIHVRPQKTPYL